MGLLDFFRRSKKTTRRTQVPTGQPQPGFQRPQTTAEKLGVSEEQYRKMSDNATREMEWRGLSYKEAMDIEVKKVKEAQEIASRAEKTRQQAEVNRQRAERERQKAESERRKAEAERRRSAERLRATGKKLPVKGPRRHVA
ncbi:MAG: hypothetical protein JXA43_02710 [Candidatus Diapherotrites archaeon]|nr:hypothetical protein [Candidatus Diapherotrites archaeon]